MNKRTLEALKKADENYWAGLPTGMTDAKFDKQSRKAGLISQTRARGWARFPKVKLARPNFGMEKIYRIEDLEKYTTGATGLMAPFYMPKYDGIYVEVSHRQVVTRGDGRIGHDISIWCNSLARVAYPIPSAFLGELVLPKPYGRNDLVRAIAADKAPPCRPIIIPHRHICIDGLPPHDIPATYHIPDIMVGGFDVDIDGWVCQFGTGGLIAYKKK